jgi:hypothetical protein
MGTVQENFESFLLWAWQGLSVLALQEEIVFNFGFLDFYIAHKEIVI